MQGPELHSAFPDRVHCHVEQCPGDVRRMEYNPVADSFVATDYSYLYSARGYRGAYGWIRGLGTPPAPHLDVLLLTASQRLRHGDLIEASICGIFWRADGDHKLVAAADDIPLPAGRTPDWDALPPAWHSQLLAIFPRLDPGEGWFGRERALDYLRRCRDQGLDPR